MAEDEGARKTAEAIVVSSTPDVCLTPMGSSMVPVPYPIIGRFDSVAGEATTVMFAGQEAFTTASRITTVRGDEAGSGGGVGSGVNTGYCRPATFRETVFAEGHNVVTHDCLMDMNCAGPDGPGNVQGGVVYLRIEMHVGLSGSGEIQGETKPAAAPETVADEGLWKKASPWVHGVLDVIGLVPGFGEIADGVNAVIYLGEGDMVGAGLSAASMIPIAGWGATAGKVGVRAEKMIAKEAIEETIEGGAKKVLKEGVEEGVEKTVKAAAEEGAEKTVKETAEEGAKETVKEAGESGVKVTRKGKFASEAKLQDHFDRHGSDFGARDKAEYEAQADQFLNGPRNEGTLETIKKNGDIVRFDPATDRFGVARSDGAIRTFYRPDPAVHGRPTNLDYFNAQH